MNNQKIVQKLWNICHVLRDDGIIYQRYLTELTYLLFLKMMKERGTDHFIPEGLRWDDLRQKEGTELKRFYQQLLKRLGEHPNEQLREIYSNASTSIGAAKNLEKIIQTIDSFKWYHAKEEALGDLYEGLLEKIACEKKSGAGQYFTPRVLIDVMVQLIDPQPGERCNDPAAGTFGFMVAADQYLKQKTNKYQDLDPQMALFQKKEAFSGMELVRETYRLAMMNALLHGIEGRLENGDSLSKKGNWLKSFDVILTNPPFGTKKGGEREWRDDLPFATTNKQLSFLQLIYQALKKNGRARAAVILPDNVLFEKSMGTLVRQDLMNKCNLHTILRLPSGIFYAPGVKANVLFFTRGSTDLGNTKEVWIYDLRTDMPSFGKRNPLTQAHFRNFIKAYLAPDRSKVVDKRWNRFAREEIAELGDHLDLGLISNKTLVINSESALTQMAEEAMDNLQQANTLFHEAIKELRQMREEIELREEELTWVPLGQICSIQTGRRNANAAEENGRFPFFTCSKKVSRINQFSFDGEAILLSGNGDFHVKYYWGKFDAYQRTYILQNFRCNGKYLFFYLMITLDRLTKAHRGTTVKYIRIQDLQNYLVCLPSEPKQRQIVEKIECLLKKWEGAQRRIAEAKKSFPHRRAAILDQAFRGILTRRWREERGRMDRTDRLVVSEDSLPKGWKWVSLSEIIHLKNGLSKRNGKEGVPTPVLRLANVCGNRFVDKDLREICLSVKERDSYLLEKDDILFIRVNGSLDLVGKAIHYSWTREAAYCDHLIRGTFDKTKLNAAYLKYLFESPLIRQQLTEKVISSAGQKTISQRNLGSLRLPLPPKDEMDEIARILQRLLTTEEVILTSLEEISQKKLLTPALLSAVFLEKPKMNSEKKEDWIDQAVLCSS
jgi:type I restriction enzyme M protein